MKPNIFLCVASAMALSCVVGMVQGAQLVQINADPDGSFQTYQDGTIATLGPRFDTYHNLLEYRGLGNVSWAGYLQDDSLFGSYGVGISDELYYPGSPMICLVNGSAFSGLTLSSGSSGGEGLGEISAMSISTNPANHLQMNLTQTLYLQAYPHAWTNDPGNSLGSHDNEIITLANNYNATTVNDSADGFLQFRIAPVLNEQIGDVVPVSLSVYSDAQVTHQYGNAGYTGYAEATTSIQLNGTMVYVDEFGMASFNAHVGDIISVKMSTMMYLAGEAVIDEPDNPILYNKVFNPVFAMASAGFNLDIPITAGTAESAPLMPDTDPAHPNDPLVFSNIAITSSGPGIDSPLWIDPAITLAYDFIITGAKATAIVMPSGIPDQDGFSIWYFDPDLNDWVRLPDLAQPGETVYLPMPVDLFYIGMIDEDLALDPTDSLAFPVGIFFDAPADNIQVTMIPYSIPEPTGLALLAIGSIAMLRRK